MKKLYPNILFSYPGEYAEFVETCAEVLERFLGKDKVFHYTEGTKKQKRGAFFETLAGWEAEPDPLYMVCITPNKRLNSAQLKEVEKWEEFLFKRDSKPSGTETRFVNIPITREQTNIYPPQTELFPIPNTLLRAGPASNLYTEVTDLDRASAERLAEYLLRKAFDLPRKEPTAKAFTYEKHIIKFYADLYAATDVTPFIALPDQLRSQFLDKFAVGVPMVWPSIRVRTDIELKQNDRLKEIGAPRLGLSPLLNRNPKSDTSARAVSVSAIIDQGSTHLSFLEAGPREMISTFSQVAIVVSGGISPGINAVIDGIVQRHWQYDKQCVVHGFTNGFFGLAQAPPNFIRLFPDHQNLRANIHCMATSAHVSRGGAMIGTYRLERLDVAGLGRMAEAEDERHPDGNSLERILGALAGYDALYVIGGDGSMKMANMLLAKLRDPRRRPISVIGIPKTMDNDILWVWQAFGFATAVEKARDVIDCLSVEKSSNPRICIVQLFGSVSGFVVSHAVLACQPGECDAALIPEAKFSIAALVDRIVRRMKDRMKDRVEQRIPDGLIVMAETAIPTDWRDFADIANLTEEERRSVEEFEKVLPPDYLEGQTSDALRSAGLKLLQRGLESRLRKIYGEVVRVFTNEPRHILRSSNPSFSDIIFGQRLGSLAVDNALAGYGDFMVSQWLTEFVLVPLRLVAVGRKRIHKDGIFWKSVLAKTGQGDLDSVPSVADTMSEQTYTELA